MRTKEYTALLGKDNSDRLRIRLRTEKNELIDVVYQYEAFIDKVWVAIVRYDCAHGFFHKDVMQPNGEKEKSAMEFDSMKNAAQYAGQDLKERWEWYKERYLKKLKI